MADGKPNNNYRQRNRNHSYENDGKFRREVREPTSWRNNNPARSNGNRPEPNQHRDTKQRFPRRDDQLSKDKFMSFNFLKNLSTMESDTAIATLANKSQQFEELLKKEMRPDIIVLVIQILSNICQGNFAANLTRILQCACSKEFFDSLEKYLQSLCFEKAKDELKNKFYHEDTKRFWSNLFAFLKRSMELMPNTTSNILGHFLESLREIVSVLKASKKIVIEEVDVDEITSMMQNSTIHQRAKNGDNNVCGEKVGDEEPPNDFREISVIPTFEDLIEKNPFLNTCKLNDAYKSVDHYLDTQFRLLREDFVRPLRNGIDAYLNEEKKYRNDDFRIYKNAKLIKFEISKRNVGYKLFFGKLNFIKNWQRSKRFMFGGLLLLSRDNFKSIVFLTVANRDEKDLAEGFVTVEPCSGNKITSDMYECNFILLESKSYFEPYYEVLTAMKKIDETNFPMKKYIVDVETSSSLPKYLNNNLILKFKGNNILPTSPGSIWPSADQLGLDESQYVAFKDAITQEFAIIQGPPGTGKTFLALEIARTLLENARYWRIFGPMVVVCLTNHALDQFLEGILKYTESVIRVGSRSKNEHLKKYSLMEQRKRFRGATHNSLLYLKKVQSENILREMLELGTILDDLTREKCIVPLSHLRFCSNTADSPDKIFRTSEELIYWLTDLCPETKKPRESQFHGMDEDFFESGNFLDEENNTVTDADVVLESSTSVNDCETPFFPLQFLDEQINLINENMNKYKRSNMPYLLRASQRKRNEIEWDLMHHPLKNPAELIYCDRWTRYWHWVKLAHDSVKNKLLGLEEMYRGSQEELNEVKELANLEVMKGFSVVGLTTTCAAKIQSSLRALKAPIVLVEEAAEILESHVVCSMTKDCQHAILIGDHKQLRPKASVYELGKNYNLNISLFERMVNVRGECNQLMYQHRMRPQIANLITPSIYEKLYNHESVLNYPKVKGIENDVFFLDHRVHETGYQNEESYVNIHEVDFFVAFAKHLLFQGYEPSEITILCTYTGQLFSFMNEMPKHSLLKQVRVTTVDNFQGEENKIILLSLVRNNGEGKVGFLKEENRVCVALSRAREGLYIMGNMSDLLVKNDIWPKINEVLKNSNAIGEFLKIRCQIHHDKIFEMKTAEDFKQCPEGGCSEVCGLLLNCGHLCKSLCHILDRAHEKYKCHDACNKSCPNEHPCPLKCYQECRPCQVKIDTQLKCSHTVPVPCHIDPNEFVCPVMVEITLTDCNHKMRKHCFVPDESVQCDHYCEIRLPCGHACSGVCHVRTDPDHLKYVCLKKCMKKNIDCMDNHICKKRCSEKCIPCPVLVDKTRSCGHVYKHFKCSLNVEEIFCEQQCEKELSCGHKCRGKCSSACPPCQERVFKESSCGHMIKIKCSEEALSSKCYKNCPKILPCGHRCANKCSESCTTECKQLVKLSQPGLCGHIFSVPCYKKNSDPLSPDLLYYCDNPCGFQLLCEHTCRGSCGMCLRGRIHRPCKEPCRTIFICGHECNILCNQECQPCTRTCEVRCSHSKCNKRCGAPCVQCEEPCDRGCIHQRCSKLCHELCDIEPCNEQCKNILTCGHPCVGFCGEPCPPLCRICDYDELTTILFGNEDDPDARFVFLPDCKHCIESEALMKWVTDFSETDKEVQVRTCPRCKTPIKSCMRIMNQIKSDLLDVWEVKRRLFSRDANDLNVKQKNYLEVLEVLTNDPIAEIFIEFKTFCRTLQTVGGVIKENRKQNLSFNEINAFKNILDVLSEISDVLKKIESWSSPHEFIKQQVKFLIGSLPKELKISRQRLEDIQLELRRLHLMVQIYNISSKNPFASTVQEYTLVMNMLTSNQRFTDKIEKEVLKIDMKKISAENLRIEREAIIKAVGLSKGHWFKCPNGHFYAIGECGGAMQVGKCIECGAQIGGTNHTLLRTNTLATELDGAQQPAWPNVLYR